MVGIGGLTGDQKLDTVPSSLCFCQNHPFPSQASGMGDSEGLSPVAGMSLVLETEAWNLRKGPEGRTSCRCGHANRDSRAVRTQLCIPVLPVPEVQLLSWEEPPSLTTTAASAQHWSLL